MAKKSKKKDNSSALNSKISPLKINSTLVKGAALTNYYSGGETATGYGEIKWDKMFDPMKKALQDAMDVYQKFGSKGDSDVCECKEEGADGVTKTYTGRRNKETGECDCFPGSGKGESETDKEERKTKPENIWPEDKKEMCKCEGKTDLPADHEDCDCSSDDTSTTTTTPPTEVPPDFVPQDCECVGADGVTKTKGKTTPDGGCDCAAEEAASTTTTTNQEELDKQNEEEQKKLEEQKKAEELRKIEEDLREKNIPIVPGQKYNRNQQKQAQEQLNNWWEVNKTPSVIEFGDRNSALSRNLGGGDIERGKNDFKFVFKNGSVSGQTNKGVDSRGNEFDYSFTTTKDGRLDFNASTWNVVLRDIPGYPKRPGKKDKTLTFTAYNWNKFIDNYNNILNSAKIKRSKLKSKEDWDKAKPGAFIRREAGESPEAYKKRFEEFEKWHSENGFTDQEIAILQMNARGFYSTKIQEKEDKQKKEDDSGVNYKEDSPVTYKIPIKKTTPFARRDRGYLNVRKKWMPNQPQQDMMGNMGTPMEYNSPFHQEEIIEDSLQQTPVSESGETIWDKMMMYGDGIDNQVEKFISHTEYDPNFQKPIETIKNQEWVSTITAWLKNKKQEIIDAGKNKDKLLEQKLNAHVNTLIQDVTSYAGKFIEWLERNGSDETPGARGGSVVSDGSRKDEKFVANLAFMGDTNTDFGIDPEGRIGIKSYGLKDIRRVQDLDSGVFRKDDSGLATFLDILGTMQDDAEANRPLNENIVKGQADLLIKQQDSLLSWAHDPLYGQAWIQDFAQANPNEDISWAMPESDMFDKERLEDEIHGWLVNKLTQAYNNRRPKNEKSVDQIHKETMVSLEKQETKKKQKLPQHMMRNSPLANKSRAQQLIEKYS